MNDNLKYKNWVLTINSNSLDKLPDEGDLEIFLSSISDEYGFQKERGSRDHYQGYFITKIRKRKLTVLNEFREWITFLNPEFSIEMVTVNRMNGTIEQNRLYCRKSETKVGDFRTSQVVYSGKDIQVLDDPANRYPWQQDVYNMVFDASDNFIEGDGRSITWISCPKGNTGKSLLVKYLCHKSDQIIKIPFGTGQQLRSSIVGLGPKKAYLIDIPRTMAAEDSLMSLLNVIEDLSGGFVCTNIYGRHEQLMMEPPVVIVISNSRCPLDKLSLDRWQAYSIYEKTLNKLELGSF